MGTREAVEGHLKMDARFVAMMMMEEEETDVSDLLMTVTGVGAQFTLPGNRSEFTLPESRPEFSLPGNRPEFTLGA